MTDCVLCKALPAKSGAAVCLDCLTDVEQERPRYKAPRFRCPCGEGPLHYLCVEWNWAHHKVAS